MAVNKKNIQTSTALFWVLFLIFLLIIILSFFNNYQSPARASLVIPRGGEGDPCVLEPGPGQIVLGCESGLQCINGTCQRPNNGSGNGNNGGGGLVCNKVGSTCRIPCYNPLGYCEVSCDQCSNVNENSSGSGNGNNGGGDSTCAVTCGPGTVLQGTMCVPATPDSTNNWQAYFSPRINSPFYPNPQQSRFNPYLLELMRPRVSDTWGDRENMFNRLTSWQLNAPHWRFQWPNGWAEGWTYESLPSSGTTPSSDSNSPPAINEPPTNNSNSGGYLPGDLNIPPGDLNIGPTSGNNNNNYSFSNEFSNESPYDSGSDNYADFGPYNIDSNTSQGQFDNYLAPGS